MQLTKKILSLALVLAMLATCLPMQAWAEETEAVELPALEAEAEVETLAASDDDLSWSLTNDGVLTISGEGSMNSNIPWNAFAAQIAKVVVEEGVTSIASSAFYECYNLAEVQLPDSLTTIGYSAFYKCTSLKNITIPSGVTRLYIDAFNECTSLERIDVDASNETFASDEHGIMFNKDMSTLILAPDGFNGSYEIPGSVTKIGGNAFYNSKNLTEVTIPGSVTIIDEYAFQNCTSLSKVNFSEGLVSIGNYAFYYCYGLTSLEIPTTVSSVGYNAFNNCDGLTEVTIPGNIISINEGVFAYCDGLVKVTIEKGIVSIGNSAFADCDNLETVSIPRTVTAIGDEAFDWCVGLKSIEIPDSVLYIDNEAFYNCRNLTEIWFRGNAPGFGSNCFYNVKATAYYPQDDETWTDQIFNANYGYDSVLTWTSYVKTEEPEDEEQEVYVIAWGYCGKTATWQVTSDGVLTISGNGEMNFSITRSGGASAPWLAYVDQISAVVVEKGITSIADAAFADCTGVETVEIADTVTSIGSEAFAGCENLTEVIIPTSVESLGDSAFAGCENLAEVTFCGDLPELGEDCFGGEAVTVYYPEENETWTQDAIESLGESVELVPYQFQAGDFNGDLAVDDGDVAYLLWHTLFADLYPIVINGDLNGDGFVNDADVAYLLWHTLFPEKYPL